MNSRGPLTAAGIYHQAVARRAGNAAWTLHVPKTSSAQVGEAIRFQRVPHELVALRRSARRGMMIGCAASTCLSGCDERVRVAAAPSGQRPGQGGENPGTAPPD